MFNLQTTKPQFSALLNINRVFNTYLTLLLLVGEIKGGVGGGLIPFLFTKMFRYSYTSY